MTGYSTLVLRIIHKKRVVMSGQRPELTIGASDAEFVFGFATRNATERSLHDERRNFIDWLALKDSEAFIYNTTRYNG